MKYSLLALIMLLALGCTDNEIAKNKSGYFVLSQLKFPANGRSSSVHQAGTEVTTDFNLGDLKASREFFFVLGNGGDNPIFDITLETNDPNFIISPTEISNLDGVDSPSGNIIPIVSLGVVHGTHINGVGFTDILQMGTNEAVVTIRGKTIENGDTVELESTFNFVVHAKVMDIKLFENGNEIDLLHPPTTTSGLPDAGGLGAVPGYNASSLDVTHFDIKNVGNVDVTVRVKNISDLNSYDEFVIAPDESSAIVFEASDPLNPEYSTMVISIDAQGTIADNNRIKLGNDGKGHFMIIR